MKKRLTWKDLKSDPTLRNKWFKDDMTLSQLKDTVSMLKSMRSSMTGSNRFQTQYLIEVGEKLIKSKNQNK